MNGDSIIWLKLFTLIKVYVFITEQPPKKMALLECKKIVPAKKRKAVAKNTEVTMVEFGDGTFGCSRCYEEGVDYDNRLHCSRCRMYEKLAYKRNGMKPSENYEEIKDGKHDNFLNKSPF